MALVACTDGAGPIVTAGAEDGVWRGLSESDVEEFKCLLLELL